MDTSLFDPIKAMSRITREVVVGFSGGKESCVVLDMCLRYFDHVEAFFMYQVPHLSFQENTLKWYEDKYGLKIMKLPHFDTSLFLRYGTYREPDETVPIISMNDIYDYVRQKTGIWWIAAGERAADSIVRGAMIKHSGSIDPKRGRFFPVAWWSKNDILEYIKVKRLYRGAESKKMGHSFSSLSGEQLYLLKEFFPADYERVKTIYPLCEAAITRMMAYGKNEI